MFMQDAAGLAAHGNSNMSDGGQGFWNGLRLQRMSPDIAAPPAKVQNTGSGGKVSQDTAVNDKAATNPAPKGDTVILRKCEQQPDS